VTTETPLRQRLRDALTVALKQRDRAALSVLRSTLAAIDNAESVDVAPDQHAGAIEASRIGLGVAEVARRELTAEQIESIVRTEIAERADVMQDYVRAGRSDRADILADEVRVLEGIVNVPPASA
jgi:uncharacterized protein YqeY